MSRRADQLDALDIALGEVPAGTQAEVADRLRDDARLRAEVERLAPVVARLERQPHDAWDAPDPPPLVVGAPLPGAASPRRGLRSRWRDAFVVRPPAAVAASLAFVAAGVAGGVLLTAGTSEGPVAPPVAQRELVLDPVEGEVQVGRGRAVLAEQATDRVRLEVRGLPADRGGRFHELWLLPAEGDGDPVAVGRFRVDEDGRALVTFRLPDDPDRYRFLDVSVEPPDGDPKHSGESVLRAPV